MVDEDQIGIECNAVLTQLLRLAGADEVTWIRSLDARAQVADDARTCGARQFGEFIERTRVGPAGRLRLQQERALAFSGSFKQGKSPARCGTSWMRPFDRIFKVRASVRPRRLLLAQLAPARRHARRHPAR